MERTQDNIYIVDRNSRTMSGEYYYSRQDDIDAEKRMVLMIVGDLIVVTKFRCQSDRWSR